MNSKIFEQLFKSWYPYLKDDLINSDYYKNLFLFLNEIYKQRLVYPEKKNIFKAFQLTNFNDLRVVIIGDEPYNNNKSTGLCFANEDNIRESSFSPYLLKIKDYLEENLYDGLYLNFDPTLEHWCKQGILPLNTALTIEKDRSHIKYWNRFTKDIVSIINQYKTGIIFCLIGENVKSFKSLINPKIHHILEDEFPYKEINNIIEKTNGKSEKISW